MNLQLPSVNIPGIGGITGPSVDFSRVTTQGDGGESSEQVMRPTGMQGFGGAMAMMLLEKSATSKDGRSILEAVTSGSLQGGVIQPTVTVETPRGTENHSPPGFRTVYIQDQPYAVFKPVAKALNLLPKGSLTERQRLDKIARKYISAQNTYKKLAPKMGLKTENRASGPKR